MNLIEKILYHTTRMYDEWKKAEGVFTKPVLSCRFGLWKNDPGLPVWRCGPLIHIAKHKNIKQCRTGTYVKVGTHYDEHLKKDIDVMGFTTHKLPRWVKNDETWIRPVRKKLRKFGLGWLPTHFYLPRWLSFHIFNYPLGWKTKWDDYRYEWAPQFTIVLFGISLSFFLHAPQTDVHGNSCLNDDFYWESMLEYNDCKNINQVISDSGYIESKENNVLVRKMILQKEYLNNKYWDDLDEEYSKKKAEDFDKTNIIWKG